MKMIHSTTAHSMTYVRIVVLFLVSLGLVWFVPTAPPRLTDFFYSHAFNLGVLYAITIGFLMSLTLSRRQLIEEYIALELNKIRRLYHLAYHLRKAQPKLDAWFKRLHKEIEAYLHSFRKISFGEYERGNLLFRKATYTVYELPSLGIAYNQDLYGALLDAASTATEAREFIRSKKDHHIGRFQWLVTVIITITFCVTIAVFTPSDLWTRITSLFAIFCVFLTLQLVFEYDRSNERKHRYIAKLYVSNYDFIKHPERPEIEP